MNHAEPSLAAEIKPRKLRIIHVDTGKYWRGSQHQIIYTATGQIKRGHDSRIVCPPDVPLAKHAKNEGIPVTEVKMRGEWDLLALTSLAFLFKQFKPDVVHLQGSHAHVLGGIAGRIARVPLIILSRRMDNPINGALARFKYHHFYDHIISVSDGVKNVLTGIGIPPERITTIHSSVHDSLWQCTGDADKIRKEFKLKPEDRIITIIAHIEPRKGYDTLLDAFPLILAKVPAAKVLVVGDGVYRPTIEKRIQEMKLIDKIILAGFRTDIADILAATDVLVSPSYLEGCCNALIEGMAAGKPVVGTNCGGTPEIIEDGVNGLLIPVKDSDALADAVVRLLTDKELAQKLGANGKQTVKEKFSVDRMVEQTLDVYYRMLSKRYGA